MCEVDRSIVNLRAQRIKASTNRVTALARSGRPAAATSPHMLSLLMSLFVVIRESLANNWHRRFQSARDVWLKLSKLWDF